ETWPDRLAASNVLCFDCHNSHGSTVTGTTTSYTSATTNGGILKDTVAGKGGYAMTYKPAAGGSTAGHNSYNPGAGICFDCHMKDTVGITPWGFKATYGATQQIMGFADTPFFGNGTFGRQLMFPYKATANMGGHFGTSSALSSPPAHAIGGLCTPCHDPHGVSPTLGANKDYAVPLLKGTWVTSPYKEDVSTADNQSYIAIAAIGYTGDYEGPTRSQAKLDSLNAAKKSYKIDQNTFSTTAKLNAVLSGVTQTDAQFAGLCLNCHAKQTLTNGTTHTWKDKNRIHESVKGWKTANTTIEHNYTCSKCHAAHNASLPRLMVTNCLDKKHRGRVANNANPIIAGSYRGSEGSGSGHMPGSYSALVGESGRLTVNNSFTCHENNDATQQWNTKTSW
ncbi:MAG: CxxxxCH/CxxCH domain-containing protein, partial [Steroidobacteraceae bacterium]|nr:CxxxxCH/CxxCH domain-containing protein [Deltaproteobacteria bacterium]